MPFRTYGVCNSAIRASISCSSERLGYIESIGIGDKVCLTLFQYIEWIILFR